MSLLHAEIKRIGSNYVRLLLGFIIGIVMVRILIGYGQDVFNIYTLITVGAGVGIMLKELMRIALVPHLSQAWSGNATTIDSKASFAEVYAASFRTATMAVLLGLVLMAGVGLFFHQLDVSEENLGAAYAFLGCRAIIMAMAVGISPMTGMMQVKMEFNRWNGLQIAERVADLISVCMPLLLGTMSQSGALTMFGIASVFLYALLYVAVARAQVREDAALTPHWRGGGRRMLAPAILGSMGWTAALVLSFNLYFRFDAFFINVQFGAAETVAFGICVQLVSMVRQVTAGLILGLDAVAAKLHFVELKTANADSRRPPRFPAAELVRQATYLQTTFTLSAFVLLWFHGADLIALWLTGQAVPAYVLDLAARLSAIMLLGIAMMSISDPWMNALNGIGDIASYVRFTLPVALLNPVLLLGAAAILGSAMTVESVGIAFSVLLAISYAILVPAVFARQSGQPLRRVLAPVARGMVAPLLALLVLMAMPQSGIPLVRTLIGAAITAALLVGDLGIYALRHRKLSIS